MTLFKYLPSERVDFLRTLRLRYSQPAVFNDPFEGKPYYTGFAPAELMEAGYPRRFRKVLSEQYASMDRAFKEGVSFEIFATLMESMRLELYSIFQQVDASFVPQINAMMNETFCEKMGALSLSEHGDNLLMWSHYAESHKGFVVEFDPAHDYFVAKSVEAENLWQLHKVEYASERPQTSAIDLDMKAILLTKHSSWNYECEWKHFGPLNQAALTFDGSPLPIHLFDFPPDCVHSITFGALMPQATRATAEAAIMDNERLRHLKIYEMRLDDRKYVLQKSPVKSPVKSR